MKPGMMRKLVEYRRTMGVCLFCGKRPAVDSKAMCAYCGGKDPAATCFECGRSTQERGKRCNLCEEHNRQRVRRFRQKLRAAGQCLSCRNNSGGRAYCASCRRRRKK